MLLFFAGGLVGVDKNLLQRVSLITSMTLPLNYIFVLLLANVDVIPKQKTTKYCLKHEGKLRLRSVKLLQTKRRKTIR